MTVVMFTLCDSDGQADRFMICTWSHDHSTTSYYELKMIPVCKTHPFISINTKYWQILGKTNIGSWEKQIPKTD